MPYLVTVTGGLRDVVLPNGNRYQGGQQAVLTDDQYGQMPDSAKAAVLASATVVGS